MFLDFPNFLLGKSQQWWICGEKPMQQGRQVEHQFKVANDLGDTSFWVSPKFSFMKNLSQSIVPIRCFCQLLHQIPQLWLDWFPPKNESFQIKFLRNFPHPIPEMDFPKKTRLLWCVFVCFFWWKPRNFPVKSGPSFCPTPSSRMMAVPWRSSGEPARWSGATGDRWQVVAGHEKRTSTCNVATRFFRVTLLGGLSDLFRG